MPNAGVRVLIVDDIAETRENIKKLLQFDPDVELVGAAQTGREGIQLAIETEPDVVLMDINMPDMDGIAATEAIRAKLPWTQIVILSVQSDSNYMRRAMLAGARDFLTKPPDIDELTAAIRRAGQMALVEKAKEFPAGAGRTGAALGSSVGFPSFQIGKIITVYSPKGGTGVTTVAANLAVALHNEETPVAVVDANLQYGDLSFFFNEQGKNNITDLASREDSLDEEILAGVMIKHHDSGINILAAPPRPENAESVSGEEFGKVIRFLTQIYSYVIVDASTMLTDITLASLDASDLIVLLTTQDIPAVKNVRLFLDLVDALGIERERILMTMNRFDKRRSITPERISENFKQEFAAVIPLEEKLVVPAMDRGVPFMLQTKTHPVARGVLKLAQSARNQIALLDERDVEPAI